MPALYGGSAVPGSNAVGSSVQRRSPDPILLAPLPHYDRLAVRKDGDFTALTSAVTVVRLDDCPVINCSFLRRILTADRVPSSSAEGTR